jgi:hypothetical protein
MLVDIKNTWPSSLFPGWIAIMRKNKKTAEKTATRIPSLAAMEVLMPTLRELKSHMMPPQMSWCQASSQCQPNIVSVLKPWEELLRTHLTHPGKWTPLPEQEPERSETLMALLEELSIIDLRVSQLSPAVEDTYV